jgi:hypothetical protein
MKGGALALFAIWLLTIALAFQSGRLSSQDMEVLQRQIAFPTTTRSSTGQGHTMTVTTTTHRDQPGWHSIDVFYGNTSHLDRVPHKWKPVAYGGKTPVTGVDWFGQEKQDYYVSRLFRNKTNGYFIDLAANDARILSNTFALERMFGWSGLCIEPNPEYWAHLAYRDCQVVGAVVGHTRMEEVSFRFQGVYGGIVGNKFDQKEQNDKKQNEATLKFTVPLLEVLQRYSAPKVIDYLSLDVEGAEDYIMENFPLDQYMIRVLTIERPNEALKKRLEGNGYVLVKRIPGFGETLWAHQSFLQEDPHVKDILESIK